MCNISTRLDSLNQQLMTISKLQKMEEECNMYPVSTCKRCSIRSCGKACRHAHHIMSLNKFNCNDKCISMIHDDSNKKIPCNIKTCKTRRKLVLYADTKFAEVQTDVKEDVPVSKSINVNTKSDIVSQDHHLQVPEKLNKSDQISSNSQLHKTYVSNKVVSTHDVKSEQTVPTRDYVHTGSNTSNPNVNNTQLLVPTKEKVLSEKNNELERKYDTESIEGTVISSGTEGTVISSGKESTTILFGTEGTEVDKKTFEKLQEELLHERKLTKELERKIKSLTCSLKCLQEDSEQRAACLKEAVETAEESVEAAEKPVETAEKSVVAAGKPVETVEKSVEVTEKPVKTAEKSVEAAKKPVKAAEKSIKTAEKSVEATDKPPTGKEEEIAKLQQQIMKVAQANTTLNQERESLRSRLQSHSEEEAKRCEAIEKEVSRMKHAAKQKENALNMERGEFMNMIRELTNVIKIQKRRICEVTGICSNQQHVLQEKDKALYNKNSELSEVKKMLESSNCVCRELEEKIEDLECCLTEESKVCNCLREQIEIFKENHSSELRIKDKIVEEQNRTIAKQRKLLQDSEKMAQQVACEFDRLKGELLDEKQRNRSLEITLEKTEAELNNMYLSECEHCKTLTDEIDCLKKEKQRTLTFTKLAYEKLHQSIKQYQMKLIYQRQQYRYIVSTVTKKDEEIQCLKNQLCQCNARFAQKMNDYVM